jgi:FlaG/FlaF family flagellin (archaellin)
MNSEDAVSPVVGVMLMLVVTIIIAAVVSGFAGGLIGSQDKSPTLSMDVTIANTGSYIGSGFTATVLGVSEPISTSDLKVVTSWSTTMKDNTDPGLTQAQKNMTNGAIFTGGSTSLPNSANVICWAGMKTNAITNWSTAPFGIGVGIKNTNSGDPMGNASKSSINSTKTGWFGQYTLKEGVSMYAYPYGSNSGMAVGGVSGMAADSGYNGVTQYAYTLGQYNTGQADPVQAVLGSGWEQLRAGDTVNVKIIYTPTGAAIYNSNIAVED